MHSWRNGLTVRAALAALLALPLAACGSDDNSALAMIVVGAPDDPFETGPRLSPAGQMVQAATVEGLVAFDEQGRVIPALADRWIVTDDGQSYIFRLRDGTWRNGDDITALSAKQAIDSAIKTLKGTPFGLDLGGIETIRVMAGRVIEIRLQRPMPYLLQLLAQPELGLLHKGEGSGPMALDRKVSTARLSPIDPSRLGLPQIEDFAARTRAIRLDALPGKDAVERFNDGEVDLVTGGRFQDFLLTRSVGLLRGTIQLDPVSGLFGLQVMNDKGFLGDPVRREALAMAIDRDALIAPFGVGNWMPTTRLVSPSLDGDLGTIGERWQDQPIDERRAVAGRRVRDWLAAQPVPKMATVPLTIWLPEGDGSTVLLNQLSNDFAAIAVSLQRVPEPGRADLVLTDDVARYPRAAWFLNRLSCAARRGLCAAGADAKVAEAAGLADIERASKLAEAETELTAANVFIPFGPPIRWSLVRGSVSGFSANTWGWHPLMPLAWLPK